MARPPRIQAAPTRRRPAPIRAIASIVNEFRKVTWPTPSAAMRLTIFVLILSLILGLFFGLAVDNFFGWIVRLIGAS